MFNPLDRDDDLSSRELIPPSSNRTLLLNDHLLVRGTLVVMLEDVESPESRDSSMRHAEGKFEGGGEIIELGKSCRRTSTSQELAHVLARTGRGASACRPVRWRGSSVTPSHWAVGCSARNKASTWVVGSGTGRRPSDPNSVSTFSDPPYFVMIR